MYSSLVISSIEEFLQVPVIVHRSLGLGEYITQILFTSDMCCTDDSSSNSFSNLVEGHSIVLLFQCAGRELCINYDSFWLSQRMVEVLSNDIHPSYEACSVFQALLLGQSSLQPIQNHSWKFPQYSGVCNSI